MAPGTRLLAVSEDARFLDLAAPMLERLGVEAVTVPEATAALARLRQEAAAGHRRALPPLLLDERLSGVTATDMALLTRADPSLRAVVLVLVGEDCGEAAHERAAGLGIRHLLPYPLEPDPLSTLLQKLCGPVAGARAAAGAGTGMRILVAEDNAINQQVAVNLLHKFGHHADVAGNGTAVVAMMEENSYDLVLMDVQMPIMGGLDATRAIRAMSGPAGRVPIIAMTANAMRGDRELCLAAGMDDYIPKPIDRVKLAALLERWRPHL